MILSFLVYVDVKPCKRSFQEINSGSSGEVKAVAAKMMLDQKNRAALSLFRQQDVMFEPTPARVRHKNVALFKSAKTTVVNLFTAFLPQAVGLESRSETLDF